MYKKVRTEDNALNLSIKLWKYLAETGGNKEDYDPKIREKYQAGCPLCEYYRTRYEFNDPNYLCKGCPLESESFCGFSYSYSVFSNWYYAEPFSEERKIQAKIIYDKLRRVKCERQK